MTDTFTFDTLSSNRDACYNKFLKTAGTDGTITPASSPITSPYWYLYEREGSRSAAGKVISSDWMALMATSASTWGVNCLKSDWTCALYKPKSGSTAGTCGFTPNTDATFIDASSGSYSPVPYANNDGTTTFSPSSTYSNAALATTNGIWSLTVSNQ
jgi:hypothetical protein